MASVELLYTDHERRRPDPPDVLDWASRAVHVHRSNCTAEEAPPRELQCSPTRKAPVSEGQGNSAPRTVPVKGHCQHPAEKVRVCCDEELETSFTYVDENVNLRLVTPDTSEKSPRSGTRLDSSNEFRVDGFHELSLMSDLASESSGKTLDYGFISAVTFLVTGISLVIISYSVPRGVKVNPDNVSAREMERLENENARIGAHLDRCVIAGLCLLTLGGIVLSTLLMISMWKGEMYRRKAFAFSKHSAKLYGSVNFRPKPSPGPSSAHGFVEENGENIS